MVVASSRGEVVVSRCRYKEKDRGDRSVVKGSPDPQGDHSSPCSQYFCLLLVIFLVELVAGVLAHVYYQRVSTRPCCRVFCWCHNGVTARGLGASHCLSSWGRCPHR